MTFSFTMPVSASLTSRNQPVPARKGKQTNLNAGLPGKSRLSSSGGQEDVFLKSKPVYPPLKHSHTRTRTVPIDTVSVGELLSDQHLVRDTQTGVVFRPDLNHIKMVPFIRNSEKGVKYESVRDGHEKKVFIYNLIEESDGPFQIRISGKRKNPDFAEDESQESPYEMVATFSHFGRTGKTQQLELVKSDQPFSFNYRDYLKQKFQAMREALHSEMTQTENPEDQLTFDPKRNYWKEAFQKQQETEAHLSDVES